MSYQQSLPTFDNHTFEPDHDFINIAAQEGAAQDSGYKDEYDVAHSVYQTYPNLSGYNTGEFYPFTEHDPTEHDQYIPVIRSASASASASATTSAPPASAMTSQKSGENDKILALMQLFTQVKEQTTGRELFRFDSDYNLEFSVKDFNSYAEFRNVLRFKTQSGYLRTQFFRICLLSEIEKYRAPINRLDLSMLVKPDKKSSTEGETTSIKWIIDKRTLDEALTTYREQLAKTNDVAQTASAPLCPWTRTANGSDTQRDIDSSRRLKLAVVRFTKAQALSLNISPTSNEYKFYEEAVCRRRHYMRTPSETGRFMGEWIRGDLRLNEDIVIQSTKNNICKPKNNVIQDNDRIRFVSTLNEFSVPRTLGYVTVRNDVITDFLDFVIDIQSACANGQVPPLVALSRMPQYADFYHTFVEPAIKQMRESVVYEQGQGAAGSPNVPNQGGPQQQSIPIRPVQPMQLVPSAGTEQPMVAPTGTPLMVVPSKSATTLGQI